MRNHLWIINSALIALFVLVMLILLVGRPSLVPRKRLDPIGGDTAAYGVTMPLVDTAYIYEHDPFGTSSMPVAAPPKAPAAPLVAPVPFAPPAQPALASQPTIPSFLPPLAIALKGIVYAPYEHDHRAVIEDKKTAHEKLYKVGDTILDAEIIRIESNKVMFLRANGQQETAYVSSFEAQKDPVYQRAEGKYAALVPVRKLSDSEFAIDPHLFVVSVTNLAQFLDMLDITTVFEKGRSIGCRIGTLEPNSLGAHLGLRSGDIVTAINDISTGTTKERVAIYRQIIHMQEGGIVKVSVLRGEQRHVVQLTYKLTSFSPKRAVQATVQPRVNNFVVPSPRPSVLTMPPASSPVQKSGAGVEKVAEKMRKNDKRAMVNYSRKPTAQYPHKVVR